MMTTAQLLRAIGIVRVSQRDDDAGHSPEVQARALLKQAQDGAFALDPRDIWDENVDDNGRVRPASGGALLHERPKLRAAVEAVERGEAHIIVAERFDRLFRDLDVQREVIQRVEAAGGRLVTAAGKISHATAEAELHANLNGAIAQYTKRTAMERSWDAVEIAIEEGRVPWKSSTPGYDTDEHGRLVPNEQAEIVERAFQMRADGATVARVRELLRESGIERSYHGVMTLLKSRVVLGEIHFGRHTPNLRAHEPIVDRVLWQRVQRVSSPRGRKAKSDRLLARLGVLRCGTCGARMVVGTSNNSGYYIYRCPPTGDCSRRCTISAEVVEGAVVEAVKGALADVEGRASAAAGAKRAVQALDEAQTALDNAIKAFAAAGVAAEPEAVAQIAALREARDRARTAVEQAGSVDDALAVSVEDWDDLTLEERRGLIRATVERVIVSPGRGPGRVEIVGR